MGLLALNVAAAVAGVELGHRVRPLLWIAAVFRA
jgi:hypothetical protein